MNTLCNLGLWLGVALSVALSACEDRNHVFHGYVEAQLTLLSSPTPGKLLKLSVYRGDRVKAGAPIYTLEALPESAALQSAQALVDQAQANYNNLLIGKRPTELAAIESQIKATEARIDFLNKEYKRYKDLTNKSYVSREQFDQTVQNLKVSRNQLRELQANLTTAKLPARDDEIKAAASKLAASKADMQQTQWRLNEKTVVAPQDGFVFDTYYKVGERVPDNKPVASLLVDNEFRAIFFVPETLLNEVKLKDKINLSCDNCKQNYTGTIYYISPSAEYTPPVIYSNSARSKLVFRVEAHLDKAGLENLHPGQPIDIRLTGEQK